MLLLVLEDSVIVAIAVIVVAAIMAKRSDALGPSVHAATSSVDIALLTFDLPSLDIHF